MLCAVVWRVLFSVAVFVCGFFACVSAFVCDLLYDAVCGVCAIACGSFVLNCLCVFFVVYCDVVRFVICLRVLLCVCACVCLGV